MILILQQLTDRTDGGIISRCPVLPLRGHRYTPVRLDYPLGRVHRGTGQSQGGPPAAMRTKRHAGNSDSGGESRWTLGEK